MGFDRPTSGTQRPWRRDFVLSALCVTGVIKASGAFVTPFTRSAGARPVAGPQLPQTQDFPLRPAHEPSRPLPFPSLYPLLSTASPSSPPPKTAAPLHLSILELLKATIGLSSGPWGLPVSNSSVVRLMVSREVWNETEPWRRYPMGFRRPVSSAFVVDVKKRYLITAQHVLHSAFRITASRPAGNGISPAHPGEKQGPEYRARVLCESVEWDLALLTIDEDDFWQGPLEALSLNSEVTCRPEALVTVAGYRNRSLTTDEWMVQGYERGSAACLNLDLYRPGEQWESRQVMPFGCSGGPVLAWHKKAYTVVGMLSAGQPDRPLLHCVPAPLIQRFIQHYEEQGKFPGACQPGFQYQPLRSRYLREKVGVGMSGDGGVVVTKVESWGGQTALREGDVIIQIDGLTVDEEGRVMTLPPDKFHVELSGLWDLWKKEGDSVTYKVYRPGVGTLTLQGTAKQCSALVPLHAPPKQYVLVGGLLFLPASQMKLQEAHMRAQCAPVECQQFLKAEPRTFPDEQVLLLWRIYPHEINDGYRERLSRLVSFNGERVVNMAHLQSLVDAALEESTWLDFEMDDASQRHILLPSFAAKATDLEIRKANRIPPPRPPHLMDDKEEGEEGEEDYEDDDDVVIL